MVVLRYFTGTVIGLIVVSGARANYAVEVYSTETARVQPEAQQVAAMLGRLPRFVKGHL